MAKQNKTVAPDLLERVAILERKLQRVGRIQVGGNPFRGTVVNVVNLPDAPDIDTDIYFVQETNTFVYWDGDSWEDISGGGGGGGGHVIQDEDVDLTQRAKLSFQGSPVVVTDDAAGDRSIVAITGGLPGPPGPPGSGGNQGPAGPQAQSFRAAIIDGAPAPDVVFDNDSMADTDSPRQLTFNHPGPYVVGATITTEADVSPGYLHVRLVRNNGLPSEFDVAEWSGTFEQSEPVRFSLTGGYMFAATDTLDIVIEDEGRVISRTYLWAIGGLGTVVSEPLVPGSAQLSLIGEQTFHYREWQVLYDEYASPGPITDGLIVEAGEIATVNEGALDGDDVPIYYAFATDAPAKFAAEEVRVVIDSSRSIYSQSTGVPYSTVQIGPMHHFDDGVYFRNLDTSDELIGYVSYDTGADEYTYSLKFNGVDVAAPIVSEILGLQIMFCSPSDGLFAFGGITVTDPDIIDAFPPGALYRAGWVFGAAMQVSEPPIPNEPSIFPLGTIVGDGLAQGVLGYIEWPGDVVGVLPGFENPISAVPWFTTTQVSETASSDFTFARRDEAGVLQGSIQCVLPADYDASVHLTVAAGSSDIDISMRIGVNVAGDVTYTDPLVWTAPAAGDVHTFSFPAIEVAANGLVFFEFDLGALDTDILNIATATFSLSPTEV